MERLRLILPQDQLHRNEASACDRMSRIVRTAGYASISIETCSPNRGRPPAQSRAGESQTEVIYYQYRHDRARRTLRSIDAQVAETENAVAGKAPNATYTPGRSITANATRSKPTSQSCSPHRPSTIGSNTKYVGA
jgi:hypothetical protein